jgi:mono/diheme cytochrome c family protein
LSGARLGDLPPTYHPPVYAGQKTVVVAVPVAPDYYYSVGEDPEAAADRVARRVMEMFEKKYAVNEPPAPPTDTPLTREDFRVVGGKAGGDLDRQVFALMNTSCVQCHKPGGTKPGNVQLFTADRKLFADPDPGREAARRARIAASVDHAEGGEMPKQQPPLRPDQVALLREWRDKVR